MPQNMTHTRWTTVLDGDLKDWVGVSEATIAELETGVVHGRRVAADQHCTPDCPGCQILDHTAKAMARLDALLDLEQQDMLDSDWSVLDEAHYHWDR